MTRSPIEECRETTGSGPIETRWVDTNKTKGEVEAKYRSRLVAREFKTDERPELFAGTPPLDMKVRVGQVARAQGDKSRWCKEYFGEASRKQQRVILVHSDVSRAYSNAPTPEHTYMEIPREAIEDGEENLCGRLTVAMYNTRSAAKAWETHQGGAQSRA